MRCCSVISDIIIGVIPQGDDVVYKLYTVDMPNINNAYQIYTPKGDFTWVFGAGQFAAFVQAEYTDGGEPTGFLPVNVGNTIGWFYTDEDPGEWTYVDLGDPQDPQPLTISENETSPTLKCFETVWELYDTYTPSNVTVGFIGPVIGGINLSFWTEFPWLSFDDPSFVSTMQYYLSMYLGKNVVVECDINGLDVTFRVKNTYFSISGNAVSEIADGSFIVLDAPFYSISCS